MRKITALVLAIVVAITLYLYQQKQQNMQDKQQIAESVRSASVPSSLSAPAPSPKQAESLAPEEFKRISKDILAALPDLSSLKTLKEEELHNVPAPVREAGAELGRVAEILEKNPNLAPEGIDFYIRCASKANTFTSIRALCFADAKKWAAKIGQKINLEHLPAKVKDLAKEL